MISALTYLIALFTVTPTVTANTTVIADDPKEIVWNKTTHDFGEIIQGTKAKYTFTFTNKGTTPIIINNATASCGCTVPNFSKEPVAPGGQGSVTVVFDSSGKNGNFSKNITVLTSIGQTTLFIKGNVTLEVQKPKSPVQIGD
jgi:hypothetical protein